MLFTLIVGDIASKFGRSEPIKQTYVIGEASKAAKDIVGENPQSIPQVKKKNVTKPGYGNVESSLTDADMDIDWMDEHSQQPAPAPAPAASTNTADTTVVEVAKQFSKATTIETAPQIPPSPLIKAASIQSINRAADAAPKCTSCGKSVYMKEEVKAIGRVWHEFCFVCGGTGSPSQGCGKTLKRHEYMDHCNQPFCNSCHSKVTVNIRAVGAVKFSTTAMKASVADNATPATTTSPTAANVRRASELLYQPASFQGDGDEVDESEWE